MNTSTQKLSAGYNEAQDDIQTHLDSGKTVLVTKQGEEGALEIDGFTGIVKNPTENPEWAKGCVNALLAERHIFYTGRLGGLYTDAMKFPDMLAFEDLSWVKVHELAEPTIDPETGVETFVDMQEQSADHEFRMSVIAEVTGIASDIDLEEGTIENAETVAIERDDTRSEEELRQLEEASQAGFGSPVAASGNA